MLRRAEAGDDAFRQQHQVRAAQLKKVDGTRRPVVVNDAESPLGWLKSRKDRNGRPLISDLPFLKPASGSAQIIGLLVSARG